MSSGENIKGKSGKLDLDSYRRMRLKYTFEEIDAQARREDLQKNPPKQQPGIRAIIIEAFKKGDRDAAYEAAKMANRRIGREVYTRQIVDGWIDEYEQVR